MSLHSDLENKLFGKIDDQLVSQVMNQNGGYKTLGLTEINGKYKNKYTFSYASTSNTKLKTSPSTYTTNYDGSNLVIFDWDNTIWPSSDFGLNSLNQNSNSNSSSQLLSYTLQSAYECILTAIQLYGSSSVVIVSNAKIEWIRACLNIFSESLMLRALLVKYNINIISAQDMYSKLYPQNPLIWKQMIFRSLIHNHYGKYKQAHVQLNNLNYSLICIGDGLCEHNAAKLAINEMNLNHISLIRLKMIPNPTSLLLTKEHKWIINHLLAKCVKSNIICNQDYYFHLIEINKKIHLYV